MDNSGNLRNLQGLTDKEIEEIYKNGYREVAKEHIAQAGMLLHGEKETKVDPALFKTWTTKKKRKHLQSKMSRRKNR